jgi:hypothetical protein
MSLKEEVRKSIKKSLIGKIEEVKTSDIAPNPEFMSQIDIANRNKRSLQSVISNCEELIKIDPEFAESCFYTVISDNKRLLRPSVNLARLIYQNYGNIRIEANVREIQYKYIISEAVCFDLETNLAVKIPVYRGIISKVTGKRFSDEQIMLTASVANAIAIRSAVFNVIPSPIIDRLLKFSIQIVKEAGKPEKTNKLFEWLLINHGITEIRILEYLLIPDKISLTEDKFIDLISICNSIKDNEVSAEDIFGGKQVFEAQEPHDLKDLFDKTKKNDK